MSGNAFELIEKRINNYLSLKSSESGLIQTGFSNIDSSLGGFRKGELIVIGGRPGMGKTTFAMQLAIQMSKFSNNILYSNLNHNLDWISDKLISQLLKIRFDRVQDLDENSTIDLDPAIIEAKGLKLSFAQGIMEVTSLLAEVKERSADVVIVDYVQLMTSSRINHEEDLSGVLNKLKQLAVEKNIVVIVLSQLSRNVERRGGDKMPRIDDLRGSGTIEEMADKIFLLYRPGYYDITEDCDGNSTINLLEVHLVLNKTGQRKGFGFYINESLTRYKIV